MRPLRPLLLLISILSCQRPQPDPEPKQYVVPKEVEPFVQAFRQAAQQRGQTVATDNLIITFGAIQARDVCGECLRQTGRTPRITLSTDRTCWQAFNAFERECLVFHELGHCLLNRDHRSDRFPKGQYVSLMNPNDVAIYAPCQYALGGDDCDKRPRRAYYHDELFNPAASATVPAWGR